MRKAANVAVVLVVLAMASGAMAAGEPPKITQGTLRAIGPEDKPLGDRPLEHTDVQSSADAVHELRGGGGEGGDGGRRVDLPSFVK